MSNIFFLKRMLTNSGTEENRIFPKKLIFSILHFLTPAMAVGRFYMSQNVPWWSIYMFFNPIWSYFYKKSEKKFFFKCLFSGFCPIPNFNPKYREQDEIFKIWYRTHRLTLAWGLRICYQNFPILYVHFPIWSVFTDNDS